jgi:hypothetical protein
MSHSLFTLLNELDAARIHYELARYQPDTVTVTITLVGQRVEAAVFSDGHMRWRDSLGPKRLRVALTCCSNSLPRTVAKPCYAPEQAVHSFQPFGGLPVKSAN